MCGIFGIHLKKLENLKLNLSKDIEILSLLSKKEGRTLLDCLFHQLMKKGFLK